MLETTIFLYQQGARRLVLKWLAVEGVVDVTSSDGGSGDSDLRGDASGRRR